MSGGFFQSDGKINVGQSDVRISAENGLDFSQDQTVGIYIPPSVKYFSGKDCYLQFDALITGDSSGADIHDTRITLDGEIGANSLFSQLRVYAGNRETLLEENTEYASYVSVKYNFEKDDVIQKKRALTEGCGNWVPNTRGTLGTTRSVTNDYVYSPYLETVNAGADKSPGAKVENPPQFIPAKITLPLHCGVFAENEKVFPNLLTNGIYVELVMAGKRNLFRQFDGALRDRRRNLLPRIYGKDAVGTAWADKDAITDLFITYDNNQKIPQNCPFVVGDLVAFTKKDGLDATVIGGGITNPGNAVISAIETDTETLKLTFTGAVTNDTGADIDEDFFVYSDSLKGADASTEYSPKCVISNVELVVHQITMSPEYERGMLSKVRENGGVVRFDFPSVAVQRHSTLASEVQSTIPLHLDYSRTKGVLCMPTDATLYPCHHQTCAEGTYMITKDKNDHFIEDWELRSNRTGIEGCSNGLSEYSFFLNGKQVPSRAINTRKTTNKIGGVDANYLIELEKALVSFGIEPKSFEYYNRNFLVGRMLAIGDNAVFDGRGRTARLDCKYDGTDTGYNTPSVNLLWKIFVSHLRTLVIKSNNISVEM
tara:strand:+ start:3821 stop:5614 length:1794 start_codon:yes stop_codon:yes gene_type:complete